MIRFTLAPSRTQCVASISVKTLHLGARAHGQLVCAAALRSYEKLRHVGDQLVYEAQLLRVKTLGVRSFLVHNSAEVQNETGMTRGSDAQFLLESLL